MKTLFGTLLALGLLSSAASAQWCPPGYGYGPRVSFHRPAQAVAPAPVAAAPAAEAPAAAPIEPAPAAEQPAPEAASPK
jgi:hypothetical protein